MSHNSKYYVKKLKDDGKNRKIDLMFKHATLSSLPQAEPQLPASSNEGDEANSNSFTPDTCPISSELQEDVCMSSVNDSDSDESECLVPDQRLFSLSKYESKYQWLYYSCAKGGYCCKLCELFASAENNIFITGTQLGTHPSRKLEGHVDGKCHKFAQEKYVWANSSSATAGRKFKRTVANMLLQNADVAKQQEIDRNRNYVRCLAKTLYFIVTKHWALDSFESMIDFIADFKPPDITQYLEYTGGTKKYASATTVSDLLTCIDNELEDALLQKVRAAPYYALLADESTDESRREQFAILVRFPDGKTVTDHFLGIIGVERTDAASLMTAIEGFLLAKGLDIKKAFFCRI